MSYNLPGIIAAVFPSVSDAPIRLQGKAIDHVFESPREILSSIKNFYLNETLKQVYIRSSDPSTLMEILPFFLAPLYLEFVIS